MGYEGKGNIKALFIKNFVLRNQVDGDAICWRGEDLVRNLLQGRREMRS